MEARPAAIVPSQPDISDRNPADYLSFEDIETQYPGCVAAGTLAVWACTHRYNFHRIVTKFGRNSRVRRDRWEQFLDSRTIGANTEVIACPNEGTPAQCTDTDSGFTPTSGMLGGVLREIFRRAELRSRLEAEMGRPFSDEEFIAFAERTGVRI